MRFDQQIVDRHPDRAAPIRVAAEEPGGGFAGNVPHLERLIAVTEHVWLIGMDLGKRSNSVVGQELGFVERAPQQPLHAVAAQQRKQMPVAVTRAPSSARRDLRARGGS